MKKKYPVNSPCQCGSGKKYKKCCGQTVEINAAMVTKSNQSDYSTVMFFIIYMYPLRLNLTYHLEKNESYPL